VNRERKIKLSVALILAMLAVIPIFYVITNFPVFNNSNVVPDEEHYVPSAVTAENWYNVTYANITYGTNTTNIWGAKEMDLVDNVNASFLENAVITTPVNIMGDAYTDSIDYWDPYFGFKDPTIVADGVVGANCYRVTYDAKTGIPILRFDNNTAQVANMDTSEMDHFNFSIKAGVSGSSLLSITFYNTAGIYFVLNPSTAITTSWVTYDYTRAALTSVGGMTASDPINWISFRFSSPQNKEFLYLDAPMFYSNVTATHRFDASFNFTSIGMYDNYALNISAVTNVTGESYQISDTFDAAAVYDLTGTGTWETFSIYINATTIHAHGFMVIMINSTLLDDDYIDYLDIDLFQVYAWNESNHRPSVLSALCTNIDGDNMYAGYRNYTLTLNVTDEDGFADIHYASVSLRTVYLAVAFKIGWFEDNNTFVKETNGDITLQTSLCSNVSAGNQIDLTFSITIEVACTQDLDMLIYGAVNDTVGAEREVSWGLGYDIITSSVVTGSLSDDRGNGGATIYASGTALYYNSTIGLASDYYDIWCYNEQGYANYSTSTISINGAFNITVITAPAVVLVDYKMSVRAEGEGVADTDYSAIDAEDSYISDEIYITFSREIYAPSSEEIVRITPHISFQYDDTEVTNYDMRVTRDGMIWKSFDETNVSDYFWDADSATAHIYDVGAITDNTYGVTDFSSESMTIVWYAGHGDDGGGAGDDDDEDDWFPWDDWIDIPDFGDDMPFFIFIIIIIIMIMICLGCWGFCGRTCCRSRTPTNRTEIRPQLMDYGKLKLNLPKIPYVPAVVKDRDKKKKRKVKKRSIFDVTLPSLTFPSVAVFTKSLSMISKSLNFSKRKRKRK